MKRLFILIFILPCVVFAQEKQLIVQGASPDLYINHTVAPKENYYSIGRLYNVSAKEIAAANNLQMDKGLNLGQSVKIPLTNSNFTQANAAAAADEAQVPVYYTVKAKEGLYRVSILHNKIAIPLIKQWNNLAGDEISTGTNLVIGHLKVKKELSALTNGAVKQPATIGAIQQEDHVMTTDNRQQTTEKKETSANDQQLQTPNPKPAIPETTDVKTPAEIEPVAVAKSVDFNGGIFKDQYETKNEIKENVLAGIFKSTSGWEDGKYYCLYNTAQPQTIIKITNNATGKSVFAKVMDAMPDIRQNKGIAILISNAAADQLGVVENKFDCTISYSK